MRGCTWRGNGQSWIFTRPKSLRRIPAVATRSFTRSSRACENASGHELPERYAALLKARNAVTSAGLYPRIRSTLPQSAIDSSSTSASCREVVGKWRDWLVSGASEQTNRWMTQGTIKNLRTLGSKLWFIDIEDDRTKLQAVCNLGSYDEEPRTSFRQGLRSLQRGDNIQIVGQLYQTSSTEPSILLIEPPRLMSPCLHPVPYDLQDEEMIIGRRHVGFLASPLADSLIDAKSEVLQRIRQFLWNDKQREVLTPIVADEAGGAIARPFQTKATEFEDRKLSLRIAPELWLKRMVVGQRRRIFEIGPAFRNEGIDTTHNPEFTICEFYRPWTSLEELMTLTEEMFSTVYTSLLNLNLPGLPSMPQDLFAPPYRRIDYITGIEQAINAQLPNLSSPTAFQELKQLVSDLSLPLQITPTMNLPQLLDKLCGKYLEQHCITPTYIVNHPACTAPLAKSHSHPSIPDQEVAARAELFVNGLELANMYEEENSPIQQRKKFLQQLEFNNDPTGKINEEYLEALEWGLPPTGGWGCGIERLTMAMTGTKRIADVLSFGTLRNVIGKRQRN